MRIAINSPSPALHVALCGAVFSHKLTAHALTLLFLLPVYLPRSYSITITLAVVFVLAKALAYFGIIDSSN